MRRWNREMHLPEGQVPRDLQMCLGVFGSAGRCKICRPVGTRGLCLASLLARQQDVGSEGS